MINRSIEDWNHNPCPKRQYYKALFNFEKQEAFDLDFKEGETIEFLDQAEDDKLWFHGKLIREGFVPLNYVEKIDSKPEMKRAPTLPARPTSDKWKPLSNQNITE